MTYDNCPVCKNCLYEKYEPLKVNLCGCSRCGDFSIEIAALGSIHLNAFNKLKNLTVKQRVNCMGLIRENVSSPLNCESFYLTVDKIDSFIKHTHPHVFEKADKLLLQIDKNTSFAGDKVELTPQDEYIGYSWAINNKEFAYLLNTYLCETKKFLKDVGSARYIITPQGYEHIQTLKQTIVDSNQGFCAMWYGGSDKTLQTKYLKLWEDGIRPAIKQAGYDEKNMIDHAHNNDINDEIIVQIRRSKFVVCDINKECGGAYFEGGFAKGLNLPVIWTCEKKELEKKCLHFDVEHYKFITWEENNLEAFCERLSNHIISTLDYGKNSLVNKV